VDSFAYGPKKKGRKFLIGWLIGAFLLGTGALAAWITIPNSPGLGYGKGRQAAQGVVLVSLVLQSDDPGLSEIGPSDTGHIAARWRNNNSVDVSITEFSYTGGPIQRVDDPTCTAPASTFTISTTTVPVGTWTVAANGGERLTTTPITTTAAFPSCLAGGLFSVQVQAKAIAS
jgi:hypothetical protein